MSVFTESICSDDLLYRMHNPISKEIDSEVEIDETELMQEFYDNTPQAFIDAIT